MYTIFNKDFNLDNIRSNFERLLHDEQFSDVQVFGNENEGEARYFGGTTLHEIKLVTLSIRLQMS